MSYDKVRSLTYNKKTELITITAASSNVTPQTFERYTYPPEVTLDKAFEYLVGGSWQFLQSNDQLMNEALLRALLSVDRSQYSLWDGIDDVRNNNKDTPDAVAYLKTLKVFKDFVLAGRKTQGLYTVQFKETGYYFHKFTKYGYQVNTTVPYKDQTTYIEYLQLLQCYPDQKPEIVRETK